MTYYDLTTHLFLQIAVIIFTCQIIIVIGKRFLGQTEVVCEMLAGFILGPSLLGAISPEFQSWLFPNDQQVLASG